MRTGVLKASVLRPNVPDSAEGSYGVGSHTKLDKSLLAGLRAAPEKAANCIMTAAGAWWVAAHEWPLLRQ